MNKIISHMYVLIKFGKPEHIEAMYKTGELYFQDPKNWKYFDKYEAVCFIKNYEPNTILEIYHDGKTIKIICSSLQELRSERNGLANCLYLLNLKDYIKDEKFNVPQHMLKYGPSCLIIFNVERFLERCTKYFEAINIPLFRQRMEYCDLKLLEGEKKIFQKNSKFKEEQEYRLFLAQPDLDNRTFHIGNMEDISVYAPNAKD